MIKILKSIKTFSDSLKIFKIFYILYILVISYKNKQEKMSELGEQQRTLYVGDLHEDVSENMLHDIFSEHGEVVTVEILSTEFGKKYAQVEMVDQETGKVLLFFCSYNI